MKFVEDHPDGNIFHTPYMMDVFKNADKHCPKLHAAIDERNGNILSLLLSVHISVLGGLISKFTSRSIIYGGVLCIDSVDGKNSLVPLMDVYNKSVKNKVLLTEIRNMNCTDELKNHFEECYYKYEDYLNYLIDLKRPIDTIFQSFSKSRRKNIKKSEKNGISIEEVIDKGKLPILYGLIKNTYSKIRIPVADFSLFISAFDRLCSREMVKFFLASVKDQYIAARIILLFKNQIFDWYAGADENYLDFYPNEMLVWHILKWGSQNGFHSFDFGGAGKPDEKYGVRDFKERFGGELVNYGRYVQIRSPRLLELSKKGYEIYRRFL
jgi:hypothetical protein